MLLKIPPNSHLLIPDELFYRMLLLIIANIPIYGELHPCHQILNDLAALPDESNTTQVLLEPFTDGIPNKTGNEADLGKQGTRKQEQSWLIGEAVTDPLVHLPDKFTVLKLLFLDAFSQDG